MPIYHPLNHNNRYWAHVDWRIYQSLFENPEMKSYKIRNIDEYTRSIVQRSVTVCCEISYLNGFIGKGKMLGTIARRVAKPSSLRAAISKTGESLTNLICHISSHVIWVFVLLLRQISIGYPPCLVAFPFTSFSSFVESFSDMFLRQKEFTVHVLFFLDPLHRHSNMK